MAPQYLKNAFIDFLTQQNNGFHSISGVRLFFLPPDDILFSLLQPEITASSGNKTELLGKKNFTVSSG